MGEFVGQGLIFAFAADGEVLALGLQRSRFIAVAGNPDFIGDALGQLSGQHGTLLKRDSAHGHEWQHIGGSHTGVCSVVLAHVDEFSGLFHRPESSLHHCSGFAHKGHHRSVGGFTGVNIQQFHTFCPFYLPCNLADYTLIAPFAEVGHTLYYLSCCCHVFILSLFL